jgi:tripartite-type tricarboxylate transporter receptor subunit TctC
MKAVFHSCLAVLLGTLACTLPAQAQYPAKPVRLILPFPPGGGTDTLGRMVAQKLSEQMGQQVVVENRPGAGANIGVEVTTKAPPDGYTLVVITLSNAVGQTAYSKLNFDLVRDLAGISRLATIPHILVVHPSVPVKSVKEYIGFTKARPGELLYSSSGAGSAAHLGGEYFSSLTGVKMVHVPYKGGGPAMVALLAGETNLGAQSPGVANAHLKAGKIRTLGSWAGSRTAALPDVPTMKEQGFDVEFYIWAGVFAPAGLPPDVAEKLRASIRQSVQDPEFKTAMANVNTPINFLEGAEFDRFVETDTKRLAAVVQKMGKTE